MRLSASMSKDLTLKMRGSIKNVDLNCQGVVKQIYAALSLVCILVFGSCAYIICQLSRVSVNLTTFTFLSSN